MNAIDAIKYDEKGLVPVIAQDNDSGKILMLAYAKREQLEKTRSSGLAHYFSRSRNAEWLKGETSGHYQHVDGILVDCDMDCVIYKVRQDGAACHTGEYSCFYRKINDDGELENE
ncbi:MAG: phosphoribosyl-AMP cyclohydrolase [Clostridia bacterium]|nr:phosphoribosyl-AMP cyclohydrolase [Clostridia bacterium]